MVQITGLIVPGQEREYKEPSPTPLCVAAASVRRQGLETGSVEPGIADVPTVPP